MPRAERDGEGNLRGLICEVIAVAQWIIRTKSLFGSINAEHYSVSVV